MNLDTVGDVLFVLGAVVFAVGALGLVRMPDFYGRLSAVGLSGGLAIILVLLGVLAYFPSWGNALLVALAIVIQLTTAGVGGGAMARAAYLTDVARSPRTHWDELATAELPDDDPRTQL
ncbi:cation:proton antiporter [Georgenia sunbinii]|uniref:cation:proton antiporter n=1 Tax=Georgenia sunbinii TaxID=3117728 RepID=UPI002F26B82A